jgi:uncharacterized protein (DUF1697 family)
VPADTVVTVTTTRYVALLRGINLGKRQLAMPAFKALLEGLGHTDVKTYLRSGQAVFTAEGAASAARSRRIESEIEEAIVAQLSMDVPVVLRDRAQIAKVLTANPFTAAESDPTKLFCVFLSEQLHTADLDGVDAASYAPEEFALARSGREIFLFLPHRMGTSKLGLVKWDRVTGKRSLVATARNWRTTQTLLRLLDG